MNNNFVKLDYLLRSSIDPFSRHAFKRHCIDRGCVFDWFPSFHVLGRRKQTGSRRRLVFLHDPHGPRLPRV